MYLEKGGRVMNKNMNRRGQASMEFLMTYGWAILAAVLAIGVLGYYGVFSPGSSLPDTCLINPPMTCGEYFVNGTGNTVRLIIQNGAGSSIDISSLAVGTCTSNTTLTTVADGTEVDYTLTGCTASVGTKFSEDITLTYLRSGKTIIETVTGDIRATAQA